MAGAAATRFMPVNLAIHYNLNVSVNFLTRMAYVNGTHSAYPSFSVKVRGETVHDFHERAPIDLSKADDVYTSSFRSLDD